MALLRISDYDPDYRQSFGDEDLKGFQLYVGPDNVGTVDDILVDQSGCIRYLVINVGVWIFGKQVLLPIGHAQINFPESRVYANALYKDQVEALPEFKSDQLVDFDYEEQVRGFYRHAEAKAPAGYGVGYAGSTSAPATPNAAPPLHVETGYAGYDMATYTYEQDPDLYAITAENHSTLARFRPKTETPQN